jgi:hypothetical protein
MQPNLNKMKNILKLAIIASIINSCAIPTPITKLTPSTIENKDYWNRGQQFVFSNDQNIWFDCAFNRLESNKLIFDVKVTNLADTMVLVDPSKFSQQVYLNDTFLAINNSALDPEMVLLNLKINESKASSDAKNARTVGIVSAVLLTGALVTIAASDKSNEKKESSFTTTIVASEATQATTSMIADDASIRANNDWDYRRLLTESFLRKTTLPKNYFVDGEVHFAYYPSAKWYRLVFTAGAAKVDFLFKQQIIYPDSVRHSTNY